MRKPYAFEHEGETYTLEESVEIVASKISESFLKNEKRVEDIKQDCKILNSLSNALLAIKQL